MHGIVARKKGEKEKREIVNNIGYSLIIFVCVTPFFSLLMAQVISMHIWNPVTGNRRSLTSNESNQ